MIFIKDKCIVDVNKLKYRSQKNLEANNDKTFGNGRLFWLLYLHFCMSQLDLSLKSSSLESPNHCKYTAKSRIETYVSIPRIIFQGFNKQANQASLLVLLIKMYFLLRRVRNHNCTVLFQAVNIIWLDPTQEYDLNNLYCAQGKRKRVGIFSSHMYINGGKKFKA